MPLLFVDDFEHGFGWSDRGRPDPAYFTRDPVRGPRLADRTSSTARASTSESRHSVEPAAVLQLLDRHNRDCAAVAERLGVPLHVTPFDPVEGAPFVAFPILRQTLLARGRALVRRAGGSSSVADALGSLDYFRAPGEPIGVNPALRLFPPRRSLAGLEPEHILFGHGEGFHGPEAARGSPHSPRDGEETAAESLARDRAVSRSPLAAAARFPSSARARCAPRRARSRPRIRPRSEAPRRHPRRPRRAPPPPTAPPRAARTR